MSRAVRILGGIQFPLTDAFPDNPELGRPVFKDGILYIYSDLNGQLTWYPMNQPKATHVHNQIVPATEVLVTHGLGTNDVMVMVYDAFGHIMEPDIELVETPENPLETRYQIRVTLTEPEGFKVITFATDTINAPGVVTEYLNAQTITVNGDPVVTQTEFQAALDEMSATFAKYAE